MTCAPSWTTIGGERGLCAVALPRSPRLRSAALAEGEALDSVANVMALIVIFIVPIVGIALFWIVHVLPEKIAHKRHHPQRDAIHMLCLLSLVFGGLLWPLAFSGPTRSPCCTRSPTARTSTRTITTRTRRRARATRRTACRPTSRRCAATSNACSQHGGTPAELTALRDQLAALEPRIAAQARRRRAAPQPRRRSPTNGNPSARHLQPSSSG